MRQDSQIRGGMGGSVGTQALLSAGMQSNSVGGGGGGGQGFI